MDITRWLYHKTMKKRKVILDSKYIPLLFRTDLFCHFFFIFYSILLLTQYVRWQFSFYDKARLYIFAYFFIIIQYCLSIQSTKMYKHFCDVVMYLHILFSVSVDNVVGSAERRVKA